jgi:transcriptional regulator with XRE-family HTH domain
MIGKNIKRLRREKGISQDKLSKLADTSLNTISKIELEENPNPTIETVQKIAGALGVSVEQLLKNKKSFKYVGEIYGTGKIGKADTG